MKKTGSMFFFIVITLSLAGCNLPGSSSEPTVDIIATQVARMLTEGVTEEANSSTETLAPPTEETQPPIESSPTPSVTVTITPTPTQDQNDPAQQLGSAAWTQDFSGSDSAWDFDYQQATFQTGSGYLNLTAKVSPNWHSWYVSSPKLKNAYVESTIIMSNCSGADHFGLAVRASSDGQQFYFMSVTCDGQWGFYRMAPDVNIYEIKPYQTATQLSNGTNNPHRVGIWMKDSNFTFYIDGEEVGTATDSTLSSAGYTGFLIAFVNNPGFTVKVDDLKYWNVP
jgi:hypothetical protein